MATIWTSPRVRAGTCCIKRSPTTTLCPNGPRTAAPTAARVRVAALSLAMAKWLRRQFDSTLAFLRASVGTGRFSCRRARLTGIPQGYAAHAWSRGGCLTADLCGRLHPPHFCPCRRPAVRCNLGTRPAYRRGHAASGRSAGGAALHQLSPGAQSRGLVSTPLEPTPLGIDRHHAVAPARAADPGGRQYAGTAHPAADRLERERPYRVEVAAGA